MSAAPSSASWDLACPSCRRILTPIDGERRRCSRCEVIYPCTGGIWRMLVAGRDEALRTFVAQYERVRSAEDRRVGDPAHLRALPFQDLSRRREYEWTLRSRSFEALVRRVVAPLERSREAWARPLRLLDLGSGLGWLSYRLALRGHQVAAIDLVTNDFDGLGVHRHYDRSFLPVQAEFDRLPFEDESVDLAIYNASFHYASDYAATLREALRVLSPGGQIVVMDTPIYRDPSSGAARVRARERAFEAQFGFRGNALRTEGFLTHDRLHVLAGQLGLQWRLVEPWYGVRWWLKPLVMRLRRAGEPARFQLVVGRRS